jgi:hypothetical protein
MVHQPRSPYEPEETGWIVDDDMLAGAGLDALFVIPLPYGELVRLGYLASACNVRRALDRLYDLRV